jgi:hypothetical protein
VGHYLGRLVVDSPRNGSPRSNHSITARVVNTGFLEAYGRMVDFKGESGAMDILLTIPTSFAMSMVAGLGCLCALSSVFTTKTSGVQHQIQDALVVFVGQLNLVLLLFCL